MARGTASVGVLVICALALAAAWAPHVAADVPGGPEGLVLGQDPRKPHEITPIVRCHACHAVVSQLFEKYGPRKHVSESDVYDELDGMCDDMSRFRVYDYIPPRMMKACASFFDAAGDDLEDLMYKAVATAQSEEEAKGIVCDATVCSGVDMSKKEEEPPMFPQQTSSSTAASKKSKKKGKKKGRKGKKGKKKRRKGKGTKRKTKRGSSEGAKPAPAAEL